MKLFGLFKKREKRDPQELLALAEANGARALKLLGSEEATETFFGGEPKASESFEWPRKEDRPLGFIGQVELGKLNASETAPWLPQTGRLLFFYDLDEWPWGFDPKDRGGWKVIYDTGDSELETVEYPEDLKEENRAPKIKYLRSEEYISIPSIERVSIEEIGLTKDDEDDYCDLTESIFGDEPQHQIGGFPGPIQGDEMEEECQLVSAGVYCGDPSGYQSKEAEELREQTNDWKLLLQFDSDDDIETMWGDCGRLYFWIKEADARSGNFDNVWMVLQCY